MKTSFFAARTAILILITTTQGPAALASEKGTKHLPTITLAGECESKLVTVMLPDEQVSSLLPERLELAKDDSLPVGQHSVTFLFQLTRSLRLPGTGLPSISPYREIVAVVNHVHIRGGTRVYSYFSRLYLDSPLPIALGYYLGYPKHYGRFEFKPGEYALRSLSEKLLASVRFAPQEHYDKSAFASNLSALQNSLGKPVIANGYGPLVCSQFHFNFGSAVAYPIESTWEIAPAFRQALAGTYRVPGLDSSPTGGVSLKASWSLDGPIPCEKIAAKRH